MCCEQAKVGHVGSINSRRTGDGTKWVRLALDRKSPTFPRM